MTTASVPTSTTAVASPSRINTPSPSPRRRGLSSLRRLGPPPPGETSRLSPRSYFTRSISAPYNSSTPSRSDIIAADRTRPKEPQHPAANEPKNQEIASQDTLRPPILQQISSYTSTLARRSITESTDMARRTPSTNPRAAASESIQNADSQRSTRAGEDTSDDVGISTNVQDSGAALENLEEKSRPPTIRFFPHQELRQGRPSLTFAPIVRTLPSETSIIRVGRYSEREGIPVSNPTGPSDAPVGFKSKVVSRKHCEFSFVNGSWQIKDVSSSSGTFLNHIRLSQPNTESRLYPVKDGDIVQLGIDFRGGEEMIFRCVKIRIECNRAWQKRPNNFK
jgi:E3 ubiquitin-protein ligase DMA1/2